MDGGFEIRLRIDPEQSEAGVHFGVDGVLIDGQFDVVQTLVKDIDAVSMHEPVKALQSP